MFSNEPVYLASLKSSCLRFVATWFFQVRRLSKCSPRYLTISAWGTTVWLMYTGGRAVSSPESERYVRGLSLVYLQSPLPSPIFNNAQVILKIDRG
jgi:hypothetical protein